MSSLSSLQVVAQAVAKDEDPDKVTVDKIKENLQAVKNLRDSENLVYKEASERLWTANPPEGGLRAGGARQLLGWAVRGGYSYRRGAFVGLGFVTGQGWRELGGRGWCWVREPSSLQYRRAKVQVHY